MWEHALCGAPGTHDALQVASQTGHTMAAGRPFLPTVERTSCHSTRAGAQRSPATATVTTNVPSTQEYESKLSTMKVAYENVKDLLASKEASSGAHLEQAAKVPAGKAHPGSGMRVHVADLLTGLTVGNVGMLLLLL